MKFISFYFTMCFVFIVNTFLYSQSSSKLLDTIIGMDHQFWNAYNNCDAELMGMYISEDIEFYHDKNGLTKGKTQLIRSIQEGLCSNSDYKLRRESVDGSVQVFPMNGYGAIISGKHRFFVTMGSEDEFLDGEARFTHLWKSGPNGWKMTRILSYDHGAAKLNPTRKVIFVSVDQLSKYAGKYETKTGEKVDISVQDGHLFLKTNKMEMPIYAFSENAFFSKIAPLVFEFVVEDGNQEVIRVKENDKLVDVALRTEAKK